MTLILGCAVGDSVYQISDRRLVYSNGIVATNTQNKSVFLDGRVAVGYTGLAEIAGKPTDRWLAEILHREFSKSADLKASFVALRDSATAIFKSIRLAPHLKRHAFQAIGWVKPNGESNLSPLILGVDNSLDMDGKWDAEARDEFILRQHLLTCEPSPTIMSVGAGCSEPEKSAIVRLVRRCARRGEPAIVMESLIRSMLWLSARHKTIGNSLLAIHIPKGCVTCEPFVRFAVDRPNPTNPTFWTVEPNLTTSGVGPNVVSQDLIICGIKEAGPGFFFSVRRRRAE